MNMFKGFSTTSTNYLRDDLQSAMQTYAVEKDQLVRQLNSLDCRERSASSVSMASSNDQVFSSSGFISPKKSSYFRAPNIAASTSSGSVVSSSSWRDNPSSDKKWKEKRDAEKIKKEKEMLKLPVIHSARHKRSEWESGNFTSDTSLTESMSTYEALPGINAGKNFLYDSMKIPSIHDPQRTDKAFDANKSKTKRKKVTFADESGEDFLSVVKSHSQDTKKETKSESKKAGIPKITIQNNQFSFSARPVRPRKTSMLPPIDISQTEAQKNPHKVTDGVNQWKSLYCNILDPEERMRALTDILHAVRLKKIQNEVTMKYGPLAIQHMDRDQLVNNYLLATASEKITYSDVNGQKRHGYIPSPRRAALKMGHRASAYQLQNYLRHMQKSRRIAEPLTDRSCQMAADGANPAIQDNIKNNPSPVPVKA